MSLAKFASLHGGLLARKGRATPATVHHGIDFAASKIDGRTVGEVNAESRSAKEISAPCLDLSDRIQNLKGDPEVVLNGHKHSFDTELLTPEPASHKETESPVVTDAVAELDERISELEGPLLPALVVGPKDAVERSRLDQDPPLEQTERRADEPWDGSERRKVDRGLAPGVPERRKPPVFGKRGAARTPLSEMSQKRFNA